MRVLWVSKNGENLFIKMASEDVELKVMLVSLIQMQWRTMFGIFVHYSTRPIYDVSMNLFCWPPSLDIFSIFPGFLRQPLSSLFSHPSSKRLESRREAEPAFPPFKVSFVWCVFVIRSQFTRKRSKAVEISWRKQQT